VTLLKFSDARENGIPFPQERALGAKAIFSVGLYNVFADARAQQRKMLEINPRCMVALIECI